VHSEDRAGRNDAEGAPHAASSSTNVTDRLMVERSPAGGFREAVSFAAHTSFLSSIRGLHRSLGALSARKQLADCTSQEECLSPALISEVAPEIILVGTLGFRDDFRLVEAFTSECTGYEPEEVEVGIGRKTPELSLRPLPAHCYDAMGGLLVGAWAALEVRRELALPLF